MTKPTPFQWLLTVLSLMFLLLTSPACHAYKDSNIYPWGENPNTHFKMYWKDASNVIQDLSSFQALYVEVHGCVWSECGVDNFDDDGENHDGDETWYLTRTRTFCANAAYSLYGIRKNNFKLVNTCSKGTYINSFFTYGGADTLAKALGLSINTKDGNRYSDKDDDSYGTSNADCVSVENYGRALSDSGSEDGGNDYEDNSQQSAKAVATTMGCAASPTSKYNRFVLAGFSDEYCSGRNFLETLDNLKLYNKAMRRVNCHKVWSLLKDDTDDNSNNNDDDAYAMDDDNENKRDLSELDDDHYITEEEEDQTHRHLSNDGNYQYKRTYNSAAEELLYQSWACDLSLYPQQCPDPYGLKRKYFNVMKSAANGQPIHFAVWNARLRKPIQIITVLLFVVGAYLAVFAYTIRNQTYIQQNGGGFRGFASLVARDAGAITVAAQEQVKKAKARHLERKKKSRKSGSGSKSKSSSNSGILSSFFGKNKKKRKKKKSKKHLRRTPSGRSLEDPDAEIGEEGSVYTELTDEYTPSQRSKSSSKFTNANYSSSRTSKAAEAAFAAAAQYDLEQQAQHHSSPNRHHHPSILPSASYGSRRSQSSRRSRSAGRNSRRSSERSSSRRRSRSPGSQGSGGRSQSAPRRMVDPSPTRSPGGSSIRRSSQRSSQVSPRRSSNRSKSPQSPRVIV